MKNRMITLFLVCFSLICAAVPSFAAMSAADQTAILAGISGSDTVFYAIGGGILIVMAGIWGFKRVKALMGG